MTASLVEHLHYDSAQEFLDGLSPRGVLFRKYARHQKEWAFRGHGSDQFRLIPKALRPHERSRLYELAELKLPAESEGDLNASQLKAEIQLIERFIQRCDDYGLRVPGHGKHLDDTLQEANRRLKVGAEVPENWPYDTILPALCLAQHHGLPTRLLDWSYSSFKAAHFAAKDALRLRRESNNKGPATDPAVGRFSVWALRISALKCMRPISVVSRQDRVDLVQVPRCDNLYLHAQEGLFTLCRINAFDNGDKVDRRALEKQIESYKVEPPYGFRELPVFYHFTIAHNEAVACLKGLEQEGVTAAALFPDYGGVVKTIEDECTQR